MYEALVARMRYHIQKANFMGLKEAESTLLLIEAADAIEELQGKYFLMTKTAEWLAEKVPKWIPVTDRLPEEKTYVLILFDTIAGKMQGVCFLYKDDDGHNCWTWLDRLGKNLFDIQPTHWMPLPEPPKEE